MKTMQWILAAILCLAMTSGAGAQEKPKRLWATAKITAVDDDRMGFTAIGERPGEVAKQEMKCRFTPRCKTFHLYMPGTLEDLKDGVSVKVYGKVSEDGLRVDNASGVVTLTHNSNAFIKTRLDGKVKWQGEDLYVESKNGLAKINPGKKGLSVTVSEHTTRDFIKPGVRAVFGAVKEGDVYNLTDELRFYVPRSEGAQ